ncbi:T9SS type A sorting domain-containing protein [uncultured Polaribacter sp.]|uniref:T9SS type A sorting domain-containing protein n=1 Tax=uncultured Polaribacter sp. TaxID=174711 RepID=UPI0030D9C0E0|tara:strand:- start:11 stop:1807 length:1797 start_codon:yes stop_codon:yes gene_type:complete
MKLKLTKVLLLTVILISKVTFAQVTTQFGPDGFIKIEEGSGGFNADLDSGDRFSRDHDQAGDIDGDRVIDLVVGARSDDDGQTDAGAVYILFMNTDGTVKSNQKISALEGGFNETLLEKNYFGYGVAGIGDYDDDNIPDIAVSAPNSTNIALYIIHLNRDGTVKSYVKNSNIIAQGLSAIGDLNNDGKIDLVACDPNSDAGGRNRGSIDILFFDNASQVITNETVRINSTSGGFGSGLEDEDNFGGREVAMLGDLDNDGTQEMAVGAFMSDGGKGAVWILSLDATNHNVVSKIKITEGLNGFNDTLSTDLNSNGTNGAQFGHAMCAPGDLNGDGIPDLITGANQQNEGEAYILYLNKDKTIKTYTKVDELEGGFDFTFGSGERFSRSISFVGDLRGDGSIAVNFGGGVGAGGTGTLYLLFFKPCTFNQEPDFNRWSGGETLFSNWTHATQTVSNPLTFEQCTFKAFENDAAYITYNHNDGRCIAMNGNVNLLASSELSTAYTNQCYGTSLSLINNEFIENSIEVYPNPAVSTIVLSNKKINFSLNDNFQIYSTTGKQLYTSNIISQETNIDISNYAKGLYFLVSKMNGKIKTFKIVKE